jgi:RimJ/RimL family protein N-acetyltransferase
MKAVIASAHTLPLICDYLFTKTGVQFDPRACQGFAVLDDDGTFMAGVLVSNVREHNGKPVDCEISCAAEHSIAWKPEVCRAVFNYVFVQLGCARCTSITKKNNTRARHFLEALNFQLEGRVRKGYDGEKDALIYGLLAEECQFIGGLNGQIVSEAATGT